MFSQAHPISPLRFGIFEVNLAARELRKHGVRVRLSGHAYEILTMLLERPGEILTREQLRARLWPAETFVDFEHGLNTAVKKLRGALGDSPQRPRYIETIPRAGYRFIAPVRFDSYSEQAGAQAPQPTVPATARVEAPQAHRTAIPRGLWVVTLGLVATFLTVAVIRLSSRPKVRVVRSTQLTNAARVDRWGRIQTDGVRLFFLERQGPRWNLMQMPASGGEKQPFASLQNMRILAVSPDASQMIVAPFASRGDSLELSLLPAVGGRPLRIGAITATDAVFTPDGKQITYTAGDGIYMAGLEGTDPRKLVAVEGIKRALDWSPDGRVLRFELEDPKAETTAIWETDVGGHPAHPVLPGWDDEPSELSGRWTRDGRYYIFVSHHHGGAQNIWALSEERYAWFAKFRGPVQLSAGPVTMDQPLLSRDGRLFVLGSNERSEYIRYDLRAREYRGLLGGAAALCTSFSSDGQWVVYCNDDALWLSRPDGSERRELVPRWFHPGAPRISPDGKELVFEGHPQGRSVPRIYLVSVDGGAPRELVVEQFPTTAPNWSPDGSSLLYCVPTEAGSAAGLYLLDRRKGGAKSKLPESAGIWKSAWSPDGKHLAAGSEDSRTIRVFDKTSHRWTEVTKGKVLGPAVWSQDSRYIYFQDVLDEGEPVRRMDLQTRRIERVFDCSTLLEGGVQRCGFEDLTPDGSLVLRLTRGDHDIYALDLELP